MSIERDPSFVGQVLAWISGGIALIGAWLWANTMGRISSLEKSKVEREEFDKYVTRADKGRDEMRETQITLFNKVDDLRDHVDRKFEKIADLIRERQ